MNIKYLVITSFFSMCLQYQVYGAFCGPNQDGGSCKDLAEYVRMLNAATPQTLPAPESQAPYLTGKEDLVEKKVYVYYKHGSGDTATFIRYLPELIKRGAEVFFRPQTLLTAMCSTCLAPSITERVEVRRTHPHFEFAQQLFWGRLGIILNNEIPPHDFQISLLGIPLLYNIDAEGRLNTKSELVPYLMPPSAIQKKWQQFLDQDPNPYKVGIVFRGASYTGQFERVGNARNIHPGLLKAALKENELHNKGVSFYSLQAGDAGIAELNAVDLHQEFFKRFPEELDGPVEGAFVGTLAALKCMKVFLTVDTGAANMAAAEGSTVWLLLAPSKVICDATFKEEDMLQGCYCDGRWEGSDVPRFFPQVRIYQQKPSESDLFLAARRAAGDLEKLIS